jgi:1,5-anhydro-D-fructose reductase (1,5-anhydro-D-mannitol-forming)
MPTVKTIRWAIIGCGDVTEVKSGPGLSKARNSELVAVMRRNAERAADYARRHHVPRWSADAHDILTASDIDAVYVASHPDTHRDYVLACAEEGKPVLVEKPMAMDHAECQEMVAACRAAGVPLWVAFYRRALPRFTAVAKLIGDGVIGEVRGVQTLRYEPLPNEDSSRMPWQINPILSNGGLFFDGACHLFDFLDWLFGPISNAMGIVENRAGAYQTEDTVSASFKFDSGVVGSGFWCYASDHREDRTTIFGAKGRLSFSTQYAQPILVEQAGGQHEIDVADPRHVHQPLIQSIVDELNGSGHCPSTGESAARTAWVMDQIMADFRQRQALLDRAHAGTDSSQKEGHRAAAIS